MITIKFKAILLWFCVLTQSLVILVEHEGDRVALRNTLYIYYLKLWQSSE